MQQRSTWNRSEITLIRKRYTGERDTRGDGAVAVINLETNEARPLPLGLEHVNHSPSGFSWGYLGSGPAQLAFAILLEHTGDPQLAIKLHQEFKFRVITNFSMESSWELTSEEIERTLTEIRESSAACQRTA